MLTWLYPEATSSRVDDAAFNASPACLSVLCSRSRCGSRIEPILSEIAALLDGDIVLALQTHSLSSLLVLLLGFIGCLK